MAAAMPQKKFYRQRAHSNPLADHTFSDPICPDQMNWPALYPTYQAEKGDCVQFLDIGCGYGGLLITLAPLFPDTYIMGMEIRVKVSDYVKERIAALRINNPGKYNNIAIVRTNAMKYLPNYFKKGQGLVYTVTDVEEVHIWMKSHLNEHPLFEEVKLESLSHDAILKFLGDCTEEGQKVTRNDGKKFTAIFKRVQSSSMD
ncbi:tRNA (guanine-N(7)-)-methyltransferase [Trichoplax sp. H2]|nr:tRNA (guanine-N(7)-)-methyltransferase [Trichoplax sp. H2]|eukprot:RDD44980.1 tRNA (guanine-N(7)-)-methyltransferase [Trichoplax sp. H2]